MQYLVHYLFDFFCLYIRATIVLEGTAWTKQYLEREFADYYRAGSLKRLSRAATDFESTPPPWLLLPPSMQTYEERGARLLSKRLWETKCYQCIWANMANVEIQWDFDKNIKRYRFETFCYGSSSRHPSSIADPLFL